MNYSTILNHIIADHGAPVHPPTYVGEVFYSGNTTVRYDCVELNRGHGDTELRWEQKSYSDSIPYVVPPEPMPEPTTEGFNWYNEQHNLVYQTMTVKRFNKPLWVLCDASFNAAQAEHTKTINKEKEMMDSFTDADAESTDGW